MSGVRRVVFMLDGCVHCEPLSSDWDHLPRYVLASDYDRDTQALKDELDNIKRSWGLILSQRDALAAERSWAETELPKWRDLAKETRIERDELRAQVQAIRRVALEMRGWIGCDDVNHRAGEFHDGDQPCRVLARLDAALQEDKT